MALERGDIVKSETLGSGTVLKSYEDGEVGVVFEDGEYVIPESSVQLVQKAPPPPKIKTYSGGARRISNELSEVQEIFLKLKIATVFEILELCEDEKSAESAQREIRGLRDLGYLVFQTKNDEGFATYSLSEQKPKGVVNPVNQSDVLAWWKNNEGKWLHDKDVIEGLGLSINKQPAVALARRTLTASGHPFLTRRLDGCRGFQFCYRNGGQR
jgi:hypothetical protein